MDRAGRDAERRLHIDIRLVHLVSICRCVSPDRCATPVAVSHDGGAGRSDRRTFGADMRAGLVRPDE